MKLRPYQEQANTDILSAWDAGHQNVMAVLPTGAGKTVLLAHIVKEHRAPTCIIAHRRELVGQISLALARNGVYHNIIGPKSVVKFCSHAHVEELRACLFEPNAPVAVAGVDTLVMCGDDLRHWLNTVTLWIQDEAHHVLANNKWGTAASMFPNAKGLGVTATPCRADGKGLARWNDGLMDTMIEGPTMRELIDQGFLTDYRIFAPKNDLDISSLKVGSTGDYTRDSVSRAVERSHIIGDVVEHYLKIAKGKLGITFAPSVEIASTIAATFNAKGVPAEVVSAKTDDRTRAHILQRFSRREILQLVNVDLFGEGFDLPAIEVVSFARPTQSFALYCQHFGRALRILEGKTCAIIIDHVGNVVRHGLPDASREWSLERREKRSSKPVDDDVIPLRACPKCAGVYERILTECPYCDHKIEPQARSGPKFVEGDLMELDAETLAEMRQAVAQIDGDAYAPSHLSGAALGNFHKNHRLRQEAQLYLRASLGWWGQEFPDDTVAERQRRFYITFGVDMLSAQALGKPDANALAQRVNMHIGRAR